MLFVFPPELPVTGNNMNYCIVAFSIVLIVSIIQWYADGKKNYKGPSIDMEAMQKGEVMGMAADGHDTEGDEKTLREESV